MCDLSEKKTSVLYQNIFDQFHQLQYLSQLCQNGPIPIPVTTKKRILSRGKSGQVADTAEEGGEEERKESPEMTRKQNDRGNGNGNGKTSNSIKQKHQNSERKNQYKQNHTPGTPSSSSPSSSSSSPSSSPSPSSSSPSPSSSSLSSWIERLNCFRKNTKIHSVMQTKFFELTSLKKNVGPHGRYCFCGCRQNL
jgi:hypothetical protein